MDDWTDLASCKDKNPDLWFPGIGESSTVAKGICAECEVRIECLQFALAVNERHGIWGGLNTNERDRVADGGTIRTKTCMYCAQRFAYWWVGGYHARTPNYCDENCRKQDRAEKRNEWRRERKLATG